MKVLIVYTHPNPNSFNHAILEHVESAAVECGHECEVHDLYAMDFNPRLDGEDFKAMHEKTQRPDVLKEQEAVSRADRMVFIHPIWWMGMPALLKGWVDRVLSQGFAYRYTENGVETLLPGKKIAYFTTAGNTEISYVEKGLDKAIDTLNNKGIFGFMGLSIDLNKRFYGVPSVTDSERAAMLTTAREDMLTFLGQ